MEHHVISTQIVKMFLELLIAFVVLDLLEMEQIVLVSLQPKENKSYFIVNKNMEARHDSISLKVYYIKLTF